jgi:hypothetical protein
MKRVLIIGGYGNFGKFIARRLAQEKDLQLIIAGRSYNQAFAFAQTLVATSKPEALALDIHAGLTDTLNQIRPDIVIHTSGPFQKQAYTVAQACLDCRVHYIDLADAREFVAEFHQLHHAAQAAGVWLISGASSVPCLTAALVDHYRPRFSHLDALDYGISTAQKTTRGLATTAAILSYTGQPFMTRLQGQSQQFYGWQGLRRRYYHGLGWRWLGYCNIPDLSLFPKRYPDLKTLRFYAGMELSWLHLGLWGLSWLVRLKLIGQLERWAPILLKLSLSFDKLGTANSAFHLELTGLNQYGNKQKICFELLALDGDGPYIPCMPAILLAQKLARGALSGSGAQACVGLIDRDEYLGALKSLKIHWVENISE